MNTAYIEKWVNRFRRHGLLNVLSDKHFLQLEYYSIFGCKLNLKNPKTFNEKLQWLKLYNRKPEYTVMVDKYKVRDYIKEKLGEEYLIPIIGVWDSPDEIDFDLLPNQFVLKCNHNSGLGMYICKDKSKLTSQDVDRIRKNLARGLAQNYYLTGREWPYKDVPRKIIAEKYMTDSVETDELRDYKFFCFNGKVKCFKVDFDRFTNHRANYYSPSGELLPFGETICPPDYDKNLILPDSLAQMIEMAERLSCGHPFLRVDFYDVMGQIYFGELTFFPASGLGRFTSDEWDEKLGSWITLPDIK